MDSPSSRIGHDQIDHHAVAIRTHRLDDAALDQVLAGMRIKEGGEQGFSDGLGVGHDRYLESDRGV